MSLRRLVSLLVFIDVTLATMVFSGCQRAEKAPAEPEPTATATIAPKPVAPAPAPAAAPTTANALTGTAGEHTSCAAGEGCEGGCKQWDKEAAKVTEREVPKGSKWLELKVTGMHCGGCERRVIAKVGSLPGVVSVEADAELGQVRVATAPDAGNAAQAVTARIESLGFKVARN